MSLWLLLLLPPLQLSRQDKAYTLGQLTDTSGVWAHIFEAVLPPPGSLVFLAPCIYTRLQRC